MVPWSLRGLSYEAARFVVHLLLRIFFKSMESSGLEKVPRRGPVLFAANHPNMLLDPLLVGFFYPGRVNFLAKSTLFDVPVLGTLLSSLGVLPVYRASDAKAEMGRNEDSFRACRQAFERGEAVGIFPEGTSHAEPHLMRLKTGAARIAFESEQPLDHRLGLKIVPVGLNYRHPDLFRSDVFVLFGDPLDPAEYRARYEEEPRAAVRELTDALSQRLRQVTINLKEASSARFVRRIDAIIAAELPGLLPGDGLEGRFQLTQGIVDAHEHFMATQPRRVARLRHRIEVYLTTLKRAGIRPGTVGGRLFQAFFYLLWAISLGVVGLPVALHGTFHNFLPYRVPGWWTAARCKYPEERATMKLSVGLVTFPLFYGLQAGIVAWFIGPAVALAYLLTLPITGLFALYYFDRLSVFFSGLGSYLVVMLNLDLRSRLLAWRAQILRELQDLHAEYTATRAEEVRSEK